MRIKGIIAIIVGILFTPVHMTWGKDKEKVEVPKALPSIQEKEVLLLDKEEEIISINSENEEASKELSKEVKREAEESVLIKNHKGFYEIWNQADLNSIEQDIKKGDTKRYYKLMEDIALVPNTFDGIEGTFQGIFDGDYHSISGLEESLFEATYGKGEIKNLDLQVDVKSDRSSVGGVVGTNFVRIQNISVQGELRGTGRYMGAIAGYNGGVISDCMVASDINHVRGSPPKEGVFSVGGLVGYNRGEIGQSSYIGKIESDYRANNIGGLAGTNEGKIENAYARGALIDTDAAFQTGIGGLVGYNFNYGKVKACYFAGEINGDIPQKKGFLCGKNKSSIENCYFEKKNPLEYAIGLGNATEYSRGLKKEEMKKVLADLLKGQGRVEWLQPYDEDVNEGYPVIGIGELALNKGFIQTTGSAIEVNPMQFDKVMIIDKNREMSITPEGLYIEEEAFKNKQLVGLKYLKVDNLGSHYKITRPVETYHLEVSVSGKAQEEEPFYIEVKKQGSDSRVKKQVDKNGICSFLLYEPGEYSVKVEIDKGKYKVIGEDYIGCNIENKEEAASFYVEQIKQPEIEEPEVEVPKEEKPEVEEPEIEVPKEEKPEIEEPEIEVPKEEKPEVGEPEVGEPEVGEPEVEVPKEEKPEIEEPEVEVPEEEKPEIEEPEVEVPKEEKPEIEEPEVEVPKEEKPEIEEPEVEVPEEENLLDQGQAEKPKVYLTYRTDKFRSNLDKNPKNDTLDTANQTKKGLIPEFGLGFELQLQGLKEDHWGYKEIFSLYTKYSSSKEKEMDSYESISVNKLQNKGKLGLSLRLDREKIREDTWHEIENSKCLSRELFAQLIWELTDGKLRKIKGYSNVQGYERSIYKEAIEYCIQSGILRGNQEGKIEPMEPITTEEAAIILYRVFNNLKTI